jgi:hypothetical protein
MWGRRVLVAASVVLCAPSVGCGLVESFDGYSDEFDGGHAGDTSLGADVVGDATGEDTRGVVDSSLDTADDTLVPGTDTSCVAGSKYCRGTCIPVTDDPLNCGGCEVVCAATKGPLSICSGGVCTCPAGTDDCGTCTHVDRDPANCGTCGKKVVDDAHWCVDGKSACRPGTSPCYEYDTVSPVYHVDCTNSASCTDTSSDGSHCTLGGGTVKRCYGSPTPAHCIGGACTTAACPTGHRSCPSTISGSESCFDIKHDSNNCGDCFIKCPLTQVCIEGTCADYRPAKSCTECVGSMSKCCTNWSIPVCVATGSACPATPGS